jgi:ATP-dependent Clp protease ATP-binding subunit ClpC
MFERFTDRTRRAVVLAQEESRQLGHGYIGGEHLLLGLLRENTAGTAAVSLGVTLEQARRAVRAIVPAGHVPAAGHIPFTAQAKKIMEGLAARGAAAGP